MFTINQRPKDEVGDDETEILYTYVTAVRHGRTSEDHLWLLGESNSSNCSKRTNPLKTTLKLLLSRPSFCHFVEAQSQMGKMSNDIFDEWFVIRCNHGVSAFDVIAVVALFASVCVMTATPQFLYPTRHLYTGLSVYRKSHSFHSELKCIHLQVCLRLVVAFRAKVVVAFLSAIFNLYTRYSLTRWVQFSGS